MSHGILTSASALAIGLALGLSGVAQAAPAATTPQTSQQPAHHKARDGDQKHGFYCNMGPGDQGEPAAGGGRILASGDDKGEDKDKDKGGGKKAPDVRTSSADVLRQQSQQQSAVTPQ